MWLLETMARQIGELGSLDELYQVLDLLDWPPQVGICLDSAHLFAAGWNLKSSAGCDELVATLEDKFGLERIKVFHLNDSLAPLGSNRDRHACIGFSISSTLGLSTSFALAFATSFNFCCSTGQRHMYCSSLQLVARQKDKGKKIEIKLGTLHEGWEKEAPGSDRVRLKGKSCWGKSMEGERFWERGSIIFHSRYDEEKVKCQLINGGGANWIKQGKEYFPKAHIYLDRFHRNKALRAALSFAPGLLEEAHRAKAAKGTLRP